MKINQFGTQSVNPYQKNYDKQAVQKTVAQPQDKMEISSHATALHTASDAVTKTRQEKIAQLTADIESGTYTLDSNSIAEYIVNLYTQQ
ncbi:flagellar biosynthesis anti-sigma factor FlgM [Bacillus subtilis]|uniref:flagellar biosynthesis anti-sigma factor FlgM n=1 Tax=Bacillus subtilis TaxID=1423 RepID=UPI002DB983A5|nr:flagellar biosynthesis anti-sigma factor FlgM [Bacillus subtilis]MEC2218992.1 flagellar biosynthesis anti-sigma factor FlgM [Bacillus subtilis]